MSLVQPGWQRAASNAAAVVRASSAQQRPPCRRGAPVIAAPAPHRRGLQHAGTQGCRQRRRRRRAGAQRLQRLASGAAAQHGRARARTSTPRASLFCSSASSAATLRWLPPSSSSTTTEGPSSWATAALAQLSPSRTHTSEPTAWAPGPAVDELMMAQLLRARCPRRASGHFQRWFSPAPRLGGFLRFRARSRRAPLPSAALTASYRAGEALARPGGSSDRLATPTQRFAG